MTNLRRIARTEPEEGAPQAGDQASGHRRAAGAPRVWPLRGVALPPAERTAAGSLLALGAALRLWLILRGWPALDSDEAIIGLMGRHILAGARPAFYYGQHYLGALDAYIAAAFFAVMGSTTLALFLSMLPLVVAFLAAAYALARAAFGPPAALLTLAYLALGPAFALLRETATIGGYQETLLLGAVLVLLVYARLRGAPPLARDDRSTTLRALATYALIGLLAGLGIWSDQLILPFVAAAFAALIIGRWREASGWPGLALLLGLVVGCWPFLIYNLQTGGGTFTELTLQNRASPHQFGPLPPLPNWLGQLGSTLSVGLPAALGSPRVCVSRGGTWSAYPPAMALVGRQMGGACTALNVAFALGVLACYAFVAWQLVRVAWVWWTRGRSRPNGHRAPIRDSAERARMWLRAMLLAGGLGTFVLYSVSRTAQTYQFTAARYLIPLYISLPLVFGTLWDLASPALIPVGRRAVDLARRVRLPARADALVNRLADARGHAPSSDSAGALAEPLAAASGAGADEADAARASARRKRQTGGYARLLPWAARARVTLAAGGLALLLAFSAYGAVATAERSGDASLFALPAPAQDQRLISALAAHGITRFVSDYWTCYRLAFESGEQLRCAVRDSKDNTLTLNGAVNRYLPYLVLVEHTPHPAYMFPAGSTQDTTFVAWTTAQHLPHTGYARFVAEGYAVYYYPGGQG